MSEVTDAHVRLRLRSFLDGQLRMRDWWRWLCLYCWDSHTPLISRIKLYGAELTSGHRTEDEYRTALEDLLKETA